MRFIVVGVGAELAFILGGGVLEGGQPLGAIAVVFGEQDDRGGHGLRVEDGDRVRRRWPWGVCFRDSGARGDGDDAGGGLGALGGKEVELAVVGEDGPVLGAEGAVEEGGVGAGGEEEEGLCLLQGLGVEGGGAGAVLDEGEALVVDGDLAGAAGHALFREAPDELGALLTEGRAREVRLLENVRGGGRFSPIIAQSSD